MRTDCGDINDHTPEWEVAMTSPEGRTGITIRHCTYCLINLLGTPAMQRDGRTVHARKIAS